MAVRTEIYENVDRSLRPGAATWVKHVVLMAATLVTATVAGTLYPFGPINILPDADPQTWSELTRFVLDLPFKYILLIGSTLGLIISDSSYLFQGLSFSVPLLLILVSHEMGHYVACRIYRVAATLPYFIPTPPLIGPAGTFGAFIKIRSPMPSRKAIFDIGVAGPLAGFMVVLPVALFSVLTMGKSSVVRSAESDAIIFSNPLLFQLMAVAAGVDLDFAVKNGFYYAAWVGLLVTALNLIPSGQLDGGHVVFAVFGEAVHRWAGRVAFLVMAILSVVGWVSYNSPSGFLIAVLLGVMMTIKHPVPWDESPIGPGRVAVAVLTLAIFIICFLPFPIRIS